MRYDPSMPLLAGLRCRCNTGDTRRHQHAPRQPRRLRTGRPTSADSPAQSPAAQQQCPQPTAAAAAAEWSQEAPPSADPLWGGPVELTTTRNYPLVRKAKFRARGWAPWKCTPGGAGSGRQWRNASTACPNADAHTTPLEES